MNRFITTICGLVLAVVSTGCMTVARGDKQKVRIDTDPTGAMLQVNDKTFTTPFNATLFRKQKYDVLITKSGYRPLAFEYVARGDGMSETALVLPGGSLIYTTDRLSGASREFGKLAVIKLVPVGTTNPSTQPVQYFEFRGMLYNSDAERQAAIDKINADFKAHLNNVKKGK